MKKYSYKKGLWHKKRRRTKAKVDKYKNRTINLNLPQALVAEKDLEQRHHKHYTTDDASNKVSKMFE